MRSADFSVTLEKMELINKLVSDLYGREVSLEDRIIRFFHSFMHIVYFDRASVLFFYKEEDGRYAKKYSVSVNWNEGYVQKYTNYYCHLDDTLPVLDKDYPVVFRSSSFFNSELRKKTEYWRDYLVPNNSIYEAAANLQLGRPAGLRASYAFYRGEGNGDFTDEELCLIGLFQPHLSNMLRQEEETMGKGRPKLPLGSLENSGSVGVCVLDASLQTLYRSRTFEKLNRRSKNALQWHLLNQCVSMGQRRGAAPECVSEYKLEEEPVYLEVRRMPDATENGGVCYWCVAYDLAHFLSRTLEQARDTHRLTPREYDILIRVIKGEKNESIARDLFLSVPSVKKTLASVYDKLEITSQKQILSRLHVL